MSETGHECRLELGCIQKPVALVKFVTTAFRIPLYLMGKSVDHWCDHGCHKAQGRHQACLLTSGLQMGIGKATCPCAIALF